MLRAHNHPYQSAIGWTVLALAIPLLWWVSHPVWQIVIEPTTFVFWHGVVEVFAVVVAMLVFTTGYRAILSAREGAVVLLGIAFFGVGLLDFLHFMSYVGMSDAVTPNTPHKSMFFWLAARMLAAMALLAYVWLPCVSITRLKKRLVLAAMLAVVGGLGYVGLLMPERVPALFVEKQGLTPLKIGLEWLIVVLLGVTLAVLWRRREALSQECLMALGFAVALSGVSELFFTMLGVVDKDSANALGHLYKVAAYLYLFHATANESLRRPLQRMQAQHQRERLVVSAAPDGVLWVDQNGEILLANPAMEMLSGYPAQELVGQNVSLFLPPHLRAQHAQSMRSYFTAQHPRVMGAMDLTLARRDGSSLPIDISLGHWEDDGKKFAIAYIRDLTERKKFEESLRHQATHDELTGLPNRWLFGLRLRHALAAAERSGLRVAVLFLDLDDFKAVNDSFSHAAGDAVLVQVAERIGGILRETDTLARLGGDEFAILLSDLSDVSEAVSVATKLLASMQEAYLVRDHEVYSGCSVGIAFYPDDAKDSETLLRYADMAVYQAKDAGRGTYACYSTEMDQRAHEDLRLHSRLKEAMSQGGLKLHYQPQVDVQSGSVVGAEALLRWHDPVLGNVSPSRFIPVAEVTGLILPLSDWVLETACRQIAAWDLAGIPLKVAVNFSAQQFRQHNLPEKVRAVLERTGAQAQWLSIEVTETVAMTHYEQARDQLNALVALGCSVALDDFGTGYSSLAYLKSLPVSKLKIDKKFMDGIPHDANDEAISKAIIVMAHSLGLTLVAEGVETDAQLDFLRQHGCETYQGWLFAKAMEADELTSLLQAATPTRLRHGGENATGVTPL
jgi:diguanylate cyclase (GGDEF)-like protein/PAS domain S-box-containing protein